MDKSLCEKQLEISEISTQDKIMASRWTWIITLTIK